MSNLITPESYVLVAGVAGGVLGYGVSLWLEASATHSLGLICSFAAAVSYLAAMYLDWE